MALEWGFPILTWLMSLLGGAQQPPPAAASTISLDIQPNPAFVGSAFAAMGVVGIAGAPAPGVSVAVYMVGSPDVRLTQADYRTAADGSYSIQEVATGPWSGTVYAGFIDPSTQQLVKSNQVPFTITMAVG